MAMSRCAFPSRAPRPAALAAALLLLPAAACSGGQAPPRARVAVDSQWTSFARGLPADSFPAPSRGVSRIVAPRWTDEAERDAAGEAGMVLDALGVAPGQRVADIGAGDGYTVARLARRVGPTGRVYGQDIVPAYLRLLADRVRDEGLANVTVVRGEAHDPRLPRDSVDAAIMVHMYHEITDPFAVLWNLAQGLRPGAKLGILDTTFPTDRHGTPLALLECELGLVGFRPERRVMTGPEEYFAIFRAPARDAIPSPAALRRAVGDGACRAP